MATYVLMSIQNIVCSLFILGYGYKSSSQTEGSFRDIREGETRPHIVLIMSDDQGWNDVGFHNPIVITPNIDRLAKNGVRLENSYVQPVCTPSRAAILSGKYPFRIGLQWLVVLHNQRKFLPRDVVTLPERLKELNYITHMIGKWHLGHCSYDLTPTSRGFDSFFGFLRAAEDFYNRTSLGGYDFWENQQVSRPPHSSYNTDLFTDRAVEIIDNHNESSPLFMYIPYSTPHFPLQVPQYFSNMYPNITDSNRKTYLGMITSLDDGIGRVVDALKRKNYMANTIIVFLSDNGGDYNFGASNLPLRGDKGDLWEGGTKSVGFVHSPLLRHQCIHKGMIHAVDWFPTILDMAKHPEVTSTDIDGVSQWQYIKQCYGSARNEFVYNIDDDVAKSAAIRWGSFKLIVGDPRVYIGDPTTNQINPADPNNTEIRLYDLSVDPSEQCNLASKKPDVLREMMTKLNQYRQFSVPAQNQPFLSTNITQPNGIARPGWC